MKISFLLSVAWAIVLVVAVLIVWTVLSAAGVWGSINDSVRSTVGDTSSSFDITNYLGLPRLLGFTMIVAVVNVVLVTAIATLVAFLYNMATQLLGGVLITFTEER